MKIFCSVFVVFVVIAAVASHYYDFDPNAERERMVKNIEFCINKWYPRRDWNKVLASEKLRYEARHCIATRTRLMDKGLKSDKEKLDIFIMDSDAPDGWRDGKNIRQVREQIWAACESEYNRYYGIKSAGMILDCLEREVKKARSDPYTIIDAKQLKSS